MRELPLDKLDGATVDGWTLSVAIDLARRPHPLAVTAESGVASWRVLEGRTNPGTRWRWPWLEARFDTRIRANSGGGEEPLLSAESQNALFRLLGTALTPGAYVMLSCDGWTETNRQLTIGIPPAATRLGELLWLAGARWYKVWYYPEGWREGHEKLQGNTPPDGEHRRRAEREIAAELRAFVDDPNSAEFGACVERAKRLLSVIDAK